MTSPAEDFTRGWEYHQAGDLRRAEAAYRHALRADPRSARTWFALGDLCEADHRPVEAAACFRQAAELAPSPRVLLQWASAEQARGADAEAQAVYRRLVTVAPDEGRGWYGLAFVSWRLGDWRECRRAAYQVLRLRPGDPQALAIIAQADRRDSTRVGQAR